MKTFYSIVALLVMSTTVCAQGGLEALRKNWGEPVEAFRVIGNIYYVGASGISAHIIATGEGIILVDTGINEMVPQIKENITTLGFAVEDIRFIVSSHAHWDHVEGHAAMKEATGAEIIALGDDAAAIESGTDNSALGSIGWTPVKVDRVFNDGDSFTLGGVAMTAHLTPGHTRGCTTWTTSVSENGKNYNVVFIGGTSINVGVKLLNNERHPSIADDYAATFEKLKALDVGVFLAQHPGMYGLEEKRTRQLAGAPVNPFINPGEYRTFIQGEELKYRRQLAREKKRQREE